jgi:hypothetical protein
MKRTLSKLALVQVLVLLAVAPAWAGEWRFPFGLTYSSGFGDVLDYHQDAVGLDADFAVPIGISFVPYYESKGGHRFGLDVGPPSIIFIEVTGFIDEDFTYFNLPLGATYGYTFLREASITPYLRVGFRHNLATGDFVDNSSPGFLAALGFETRRQKRVGFAFEAAYDNATIEFVDDFGFNSLPPEEIEAGGVQISFRAIFY